VVVREARRGRNRTRRLDPPPTQLTSAIRRPPTTSWALHKNRVDVADAIVQGDSSCAAGCTQPRRSVDGLAARLGAMFSGRLVCGTVDAREPAGLVSHGKASGTTQRAPSTALSVLLSCAFCNRGWTMRPAREHADLPFGGWRSALASVAALVRGTRPTERDPPDTHRQQVFRAPIGCGRGGAPGAVSLCTTDRDGQRTRRRITARCRNVRRVLRARGRQRFAA
jgi:hypothetical protein